ncbi:MAG: hypothetical protein WDW38_010896 [Sanguina aurantia]
MLDTFLASLDITGLKNSDLEASKGITRGAAISLTKQRSLSQNSKSSDASLSLSRRTNNSNSWTEETWGSNDDPETASDPHPDRVVVPGGRSHSTQEDILDPADLEQPHWNNLTAPAAAASADSVFGCEWVRPVCLPPGAPTLITIQLPSHPGWGMVGAGQLGPGSVVRVVASQDQTVLLDLRVTVTEGRQLRLYAEGEVALGILDIHVYTADHSTPGPPAPDSLAARASLLVLPLPAALELQQLFGRMVDTLQAPHAAAGPSPAASALSVEGEAWLCHIQPLISDLSSLLSLADTLQQQEPCHLDPAQCGLAGAGLGRAGPSQALRPEELSPSSGSLGNMFDTQSDAAPAALWTQQVEHLNAFFTSRGMPCCGDIAASIAAMLPSSEPVGQGLPLEGHAELSSRSFHDAQAWSARDECLQQGLAAAASTGSDAGLGVDATARDTATSVACNIAEPAHCLDLLFSLLA